MNRQENTRRWYENYYGKMGANRNDLRSNPEVLFQTLALEASVVRALAVVGGDPICACVLDVGCGRGGNLYQLLRLGYEASNISGIDILPANVEVARRIYPNMRFVVGDASRMEFANASFDLLFESTMFATLPDDMLAASIAREMVRVCKPGGYLLLVDWRTPKPRDSNYKALTRKRLREMFGVGCGTRLIAVSRGALVPPVGRFLSKYLPSTYFLIAAAFPFLVGQVAYVLQKSVDDPKS
jgi:ubiquinone/menaquinone biosynthesis C-methylase UbiE